MGKAIKLKTQVVVVGAGPAGAATSFFLTKEGIDHVVVEKAVFPRDKVCGDVSSKHALNTLERANPEWAKELVARSDTFLPAWGISFLAPGGLRLDIPYTPGGRKDVGPYVFVAKRLDFDNFLFSKMPSPYCTIFQNASVTNIKTDDKGAYLSFEQDGNMYDVEARIIVGADGDKSVVRRTLMDKGEAKKSNSVGLRAYYTGISGLHKDNYIELHFLPGLLPCYLWIFPLPHGMANVGVGILADVLKKEKINLRERMVDAIKNHPRLAPRFKNATLEGPILGWGLPLAMDRQPLSGDRYILVGDAGGLIDPFTGEGIGNAMFTGMLGAIGIKQALEKNDTSASFLKTYYDDPFYHSMGQELKISLLLQKASKYPWLINYMVKKASKSVTLRETMNNIVAGSAPPPEVTKLSFYLKILFNK